MSGTRIAIAAVVAILSMGTWVLAQEQEFDREFLEKMSAHHQQAVDMAKEAMQKARHDELKKMAQKMMKDQQAEIRQMQSWRQAWYKDAPVTKPEGMEGMHQSETPGRMKTSAGNFDVEWIDKMIPHHEEAIKMSREAEQKAKRAEVKQLAQKIAREQQAEIEQMKKLKTEVSRG